MANVPYFGPLALNAITDIKITRQINDPDPNWQVYRQDLNAGAGGDFLYLAVKRTADARGPIRLAYIYVSDTALTVNPGGQGAEWDPQDLNAGAGGKFIYFVWRRHSLHPRPDPAPITDFRFAQTDRDPTPPTVAHYTVLNESFEPVDLNDGCGWEVPFIWCYLTRETMLSDLVMKPRFIRGGNTDGPPHYEYFDPSELAE